MQSTECFIDLDENAEIVLKVKVWFLDSVEDGLELMKVHPIGIESQIPTLGLQFMPNVQSEENMRDFSAYVRSRIPWLEQIESQIFAEQAGIDENARMRIGLKPDDQDCL